jgi:hypothetical protein
MARWYWKWVVAVWRASHGTSTGTINSWGSYWEAVYSVLSRYNWYHSF